MSQSRVALVIANDEYVDTGLRQLAAPARDADALATVLGDPAIGDFEVTTLHNGSAQEIRLAVEDFFADRSPEDLLVLHFSCHGVKNAAGELYLASADTRPSRLASTAVAADFVNRQMAESRAQRIALFLDCCYGGAFPRGMVVRASAAADVQEAFAGQKDAGGGRGRVIVTASSAMEYSFEGDQLAQGSGSGPSVFTEALVSGLTTGDADRDGDGWVGLGELFSFVSDRVTLRMPQQTPQMWTFGAQGDMHIARTKVRRVIATALPAEVTEALASPTALVRFGAVDDLRDRLHSANLGQALSALNALGPVVEDDSRRVADAAAAALLSAALRVAPDSLALTTDQLTAELTLDGSALALCALASSPDAWLEVEQDGPTVRVRAIAGAVPSTSSTSAIDGSVILDGPTGQHVVAVSLQLASAVPAPAPAPASAPAPAKRKTTPRPVAVTATPTPAPAPAPAKRKTTPSPAAASAGRRLPLGQRLPPLARGLFGAGLLVCALNFGFTVPLDASSFYPPPIAAAVAAAYVLIVNRLSAAMVGVLLVAAAELIGSALVLLVEGSHYFPNESGASRVVLILSALAFTAIVAVAVRHRRIKSAAIIGLARRSILPLAALAFAVTAGFCVVANHYTSGIFCSYTGGSRCYTFTSSLQLPDTLGVLIAAVGPVLTLAFTTWTSRRAQAIGALAGGIFGCVVTGSVRVLSLQSYPSDPGTLATSTAVYATISAVVAVAIAAFALWRLAEPRPAEVGDPDQSRDAH